MRYDLKNRLTIIIEAAKNKSNTQYLMQTINDFEQKLSQKGFKISLKKEPQGKKVNTNYISPEDWDYWPV